MTAPDRLKGILPVNQLAGEDQVETALLLGMFQDAEGYLRSFKWCPPIAESFFGYGVGGVVAVFLFKLAAKVGGDDDCLWVVVGDVPSAYLVVDDASDSAAALAVYCDLMDGWISAVLHGSSLTEAFPVAAPATPEYANLLGSRIEFIRQQIIPSAAERDRMR